MEKRDDDVRIQFFYIDERRSEDARSYKKKKKMSSNIDARAKPVRVETQSQRI